MNSRNDAVKNEMRDAFERAYLSGDASEESKDNVRKWLISWRTAGGYSHTTLQAHLIGFCLGRESHISIQEAWELAGGNPGIKATREELVCALKLLDEICDEADEAPKVKRGPKVDAGMRLSKARLVPPQTKKTMQTVGKEIRKVREQMGLTQTEFGNLIGLEQTAVSAAERGLITKRGDRGISAIAKAEKLLAHIKETLPRSVGNAPVIITAKAPVTIYSCTCETCGHVWKSRRGAKGTPNNCPVKNCRSVRISFEPEQTTQLLMSASALKASALVDSLITIEHDKSKPLGTLSVHIAKPRESGPKTFRLRNGDLKIDDDTELLDKHVAMIINRENAAAEAAYWSEFKEFVNRNKGRTFPRSERVCVGPIDLYVRAGGCFFYEGERRDAIEISRIDIPLKYRGKGLAKHFFSEVSEFAKVNGIPYITVAQVHNENFREQLCAWGFNRYIQPGNEEDFIYVKEISQ